MEPPPEQSYHPISDGRPHAPYAPVYPYQGYARPVPPQYYSHSSPAHIGPTVPYSQDYTMPPHSSWEVSTYSHREPLAPRTTLSATTTWSGQTARPPHTAAPPRFPPHSRSIPSMPPPPPLHGATLPPPASAAGFSIPTATAMHVPFEPAHMVGSTWSRAQADGSTVPGVSFFDHYKFARIPQPRSEMATTTGWAEMAYSMLGRSALTDTFEILLTTEDQRGDAHSKLVVRRIMFGVGTPPEQVENTWVKEAVVPLQLAETLKRDCNTVPGAANLLIMVDAFKRVNSDGSTVLYVVHERPQLGYRSLVACHTALPEPLVADTLRHPESPPSSTLEGYIKSGHITETAAYYIFLQLLSAAYCLRHNEVVHGSLSPSKILIWRWNTESTALGDVPLPDIKLADYGSEIHGEITTAFAYSPSTEELSDRKDVYAIGCILHRMLTVAKDPSHKDAQPYVPSNSSFWQAPACVDVAGNPSPVEAILRAMTQSDRQKRPTPQQVLETYFHS